MRPVYARVRPRDDPVDERRARGRAPTRPTARLVGAGAARPRSRPCWTRNGPGQRERACRPRRARSRSSSGRRYGRRNAPEPEASRWPRPPRPRRPRGRRRRAAARRPARAARAWARARRRAADAARRRAAAAHAAARHRGPGRRDERRAPPSAVAAAGPSAPRSRRRRVGRRPPGRRRPARVDRARRRRASSPGPGEQRRGTRVDDASSSSWVPLVDHPAVRRSRTMRSARRSVERRWAMRIVVRSGHDLAQRGVDLLLGARRRPTTWRRRASACAGR